MQLELAFLRNHSVRTALVLSAVSLVVVFGGLWLLSNRQQPPRAASTIEARIELAAGDVTLEHGGQRDRIRSGAVIAPGSTIATGTGARAFVRLQDGSAVFVRDSTQVVLEAQGLSLVSGERFINAAPAEQKAQVHHTGDVYVAAADAGLSIARAGERVVVTVTRGSATVSTSNGRVEIQAGQQVKIEGKTAPATSPVAYFDDWTGGMADLPAHAATSTVGAGTIYGVDATRADGSLPSRLEVQRQSIRAVLRDELAETEVDQTFFNPSDHPVEGWYWMVVPEGASITGFALETDNVLVEGELIERKEASTRYQSARQTGHSPAILEWINERTVRARIFPINGASTRRVVVRYVELKPVIDGKLTYVYPMGLGEPTRVGEFSLSVDLGSRGRKMQIATLAEARIEDGGERVTVRRSGYTPRAPFQLEATIKEPRTAMSVARFAAGGDSADYVLARYTPEVDWASARSSRADIVVVVDTSGAGDETSRGLKVGVTEAILRALGAEDRFALVSVDVAPKVLYPAAGLSPAKPENVSQALERLAEHSNGGATDLGASFDVALDRLHGTDQPAVVLVGDGIATSGEVEPEKLIERLRRALETSRARVFSVGIGYDARHSLLEALARVGGGQHLMLDKNDETTRKALELTAAIRTPTITDLEVDLGAGLDDAVSNVTGKMMQGQEYLLLARTHHDLPKFAVVRGRLGGKKFETRHSIDKNSGPGVAYTPRLWAAEQIRRLLATARNPDEERGRVVAWGLEYGLLTPYTSFLALENEAAYAQMGIRRKTSALRPARLASIGEQTGAAANPGSILPIFVGCSREEAPAPAGAVAPTEAKAEGASNDNAASKESKEEVSEAPASPTPESAKAPEPKPAFAAALRARAASEESPDAKGKSGGRRDDEALKKEAAFKPPSAGFQDDRTPSATGGVRPQAARNIATLAAKPAVLASGNARSDSLTRSSRLAPSACSDLSKRSLSDRVVIWYRRLAAARNAVELLERYETAKRSCELTDWLAERTFLGLLEVRLSNEGDVRLVLNRFADQPDVRSFIASRLLRRSTDPRIAVAVREVLFGNAVDWLSVDRSLQSIKDPEKRLVQLRKAVAKAPTDPEGSLRVLKELVRAGRASEALELGRRTKESGLFTPELTRRVGDLLTHDKQPEQGPRVYSELVEFAPDDRSARQMLGDIYLANRWFDPAYRQYQLLTQMSPETPLFWLRLATAAAGAGRTDEALRIERRVATAEGTPGPDDPRRYARLLATSQLAALLADAQKKASDAQLAHQLDSITRDIKELALFSSPGRLVIAEWLDPSVDLLLTLVSDKENANLGDVTDAAPIGLQAAWLSPVERDAAKIRLVRRSTLAEVGTEVGITLIDWNGNAFQVSHRALNLPPDAAFIDG